MKVFKRSMGKRADACYYESQTKTPEGVSQSIKDAGAGRHNLGKPHVWQASGCREPRRVVGAHLEATAKVVPGSAALFLDVASACLLSLAPSTAP